MTLRLVSLDSQQAIEPTDGGRLVVWEHCEYHLEGLCETDARRLSSVISRRLPGGAVILNFRNYVGHAELGGIPLTVRSRKLDPGLFDAMLGDLTSAISQLPFSCNSPTALPYGDGFSDSQEVLFHRWIVLRDWLRAGSPRPGLRGDLASVERDPHSRLVHVDVEISAAVDKPHVDTLARLATGQGQWVQIAEGAPVSSSLSARLIRARTGKSLFPERVASRRPVWTTDTPENRFVRHALETAYRLNLAFQRLTAGCLNPALNAEAGEIRRALERALTSPWLADVGPMRHFPAQSTVLQRREGYRGILAGYLRMLGALAYPVDSADLARMLENRDIATLYEYWAYFKVADALRRILGSPRDALVVAAGPWKVDLSRETLIIWQRGPMEVKLGYNRTFGGRSPGSSYSMDLRPDITLEVGDHRYLFDAKFKLPDRSASGAPAPPIEDIHKMHAYRDAISGVAWALALYPGEPGQDFIFKDPVSSGGVGAIALLPGKGVDRESFLEALLGRILCDTALSGETLTAGVRRPHHPSAPSSKHTLTNLVNGR